MTKPSFDGHDGLSEFSKAQWEELINPEGFSPNDATFLGGAALEPILPKAPMPHLSSIPAERDFTKLTGKRLNDEELT